MQQDDFYLIIGELYVQRRILQDENEKKQSVIDQLRNENMELKEKAENQNDE